jgi:membrane-associated phospholipid phosphatase
LGRFRPRPAEVVLLLFVGYCLVRAAALGAVTIDAPPSLPRGDILVAMLLVLSIRLALEYRATPWPADFVSQKRLHGVLLVAFLLAGIVPTVVMFAIPRYAPDLRSQGGGAVAQSVLSAYAWARIVLTFVLPGAIFWLASGLYVKKYGRFTVVGLLKESAPGAIDVLRDWAPPLALVYCYVALGPILNQRLFPDRDEVIARIDAALFFGHDPLRLCERIISAPLSEWLSGCYVFYGPLYPLVLGAIYAKSERAPFREAAFAVTLVLAIGYVGYALVPVKGPVFVEKFDRSLDLYYTAWLKDQLMDRTRVPRDCFPSLHTGASLTLLWSAARHAPKLARFLFPVVLCIPFACVYLRYHYVTDVLAGFTLFATVAVCTSRSKTLQAAFRSGSR